jgi:thioredoxin 1
MIGLFKLKDKKPAKQIQQDEWPQHVESLNHSSFYDFIKKYPLSVIDFWAPWCNPCKTMLPRLRRLERLYVGKVAFGRLNTQQEKDIAKQFNIMGIPHFAFFHYGKKIGSTTGLKSVGEMKNLLDNYILKFK